MAWRDWVNRFDRRVARVRRTRAILVMALALTACGGQSSVFGQDPAPARDGAAGMEEAEAAQEAAEVQPPTTYLSGAVYLLCAGTSCLCAVLLLRGYSKNGVRLLFWSGLCFVGLAVDNVMLYVDLVIVPDVNIAIWRRLPGLVAMVLLGFGLVWDSK